MRTIRTYLSIILLAVIFFSVMPKEFIHNLYGHTDTIEDEYCLHGILHIENTHHHCEMLNYAAFPFEENASAILFQPVPFSESLISQNDYGFVSRTLYNLSRFRAPPIA